MVAYSIAAIAALATAASAQAIKGFNYGATLTTGAAKTVDDFTSEFKQAQGLVGAPGFTSARLYTSIQGGTTNSPSSAFQAAVNTKTRLLLGMWASSGDQTIQYELDALTSAINNLGSDFTNLIDGLSVGSEDLYRITPTGIMNKAGIGADPQDIVNYINQVRSALKSTSASGVKIGHVDTWTAWVNGSNSAVVDACDFIGMDAYPYFQTSEANSIEQGASDFDAALGVTKNAAGSKPVWITETGWPVSGPVSGQAVASIANAKTYWDAVACKYLGTTNTWWYTLQDALPDTPSPSFGLVGAAGGTTPLYDLSCSATNSSSSSSSSAAASSTAASSGSGSASASGSGSMTMVSPVTMTGSNGVVSTAMSTQVVAGNAAASSGAASAGYGPGPAVAPSSSRAASAGAGAGATTAAASSPKASAASTPYTGGASFPTGMANLALAGAGLAAAVML